jgi:hypothetical protein
VFVSALITLMLFDPDWRRRFVLLVIGRDGGLAADWNRLCQRKSAQVSTLTVLLLAVGDVGVPAVGGPVG